MKPVNYTSSQRSLLEIDECGFSQRVKGTDVYIQIAVRYGKSGCQEAEKNEP